MYNELVKSLRELCEMTALCDEHSCFECPYEEKCSAYKNGILSAVYRLAADAIEELTRRVDESIPKDDAEIIIAEVAKPRWIPVTERLPEDLTRVIVFCEDGVSYGLCEHLIADDEEVVEWHDFLHYPITPTHWMPLPIPPQAEEGET